VDEPRNVLSDVSAELGEVHHKLVYQPRGNGRIPLTPSPVRSSAILSRGHPDRSRERRAVAASSLSRRTPDSVEGRQSATGRTWGDASSDDATSSRQLVHGGHHRRRCGLRGRARHRHGDPTTVPADRPGAPPRVPIERLGEWGGTDYAVSGISCRELNDLVLKGFAPAGDTTTGRALMFDGWVCFQDQIGGRYSPVLTVCADGARCFRFLFH